MCNIYIGENWLHMLLWLSLELICCFCCWAHVSRFVLGLDVYWSLLWWTHTVLVFRVEAQIVLFFLLHCTACCCFVSSKLTLTSPDAQVHFILALQWVDDIGLLLAIHIISCKCILKLWLFFYHTHSRNLDNHQFTSASKVPAAFTKIHIVSLCVCFVQLLFMCLKIWLPTLLMVELLVFYVLLLLPANICSNAADLLRLSVYIVWVVAWHMYYDAVMCDVDFCCDAKQLMSEC